MVKAPLKDTYLRGKTTKALKNEVSLGHKLYNNKETRIMANESVNYFTPDSSLKSMHYHRMSNSHRTMLQTSSTT